MKKRILMLWAAVCLFTVGQMWAQTDVTSQYVKNPSFEYSAEGVANTGDVKLSNGATFYGWTAPTLNNSYVNIEVTSSAPNSGYGKSVKASDGNYFFFNRQGWGDATSSLSQVIPSLPVGKYYLCADYKSAGVNQNTKLGIKASQGSTVLVNTSTYVSVVKPGDTYFNTTPWKIIGAWFTVESAGEVKIEFTETLAGSGGRGDIILDNVRLYQWDVNDDVNYEMATASTPMDVTAKFVSNAYFDSNTNGWTSATGYQNTGLASNQAGTMSSYFLENWNGSAKTGKIYSTANGLPSGIYRLTMSAFGNNATSSNTTLVVYAGEASTPVVSATPSLYTVETVVKNGTLEFGLNLLSGNNCNWIGIDNIRLEYCGADLSLLEEALAQKVAVAQGLSVENLNTYAKSALPAAIATANDVLADAGKTRQQLNESSNRLQTIIDLCNELYILYPQIISALESANDTYTNSECINADDKTAFGNTLTLLKNQVEEVQTVAQVNEVKASVDAAYLAYLKNAPQFTNGYVLDMTSLIKNPGFESGKDGGWTLTSSTDGWFDHSTNTTNPSEGANCINIWASTINSLDLYQNISALPVGKYRLTADVRTEKESQITDQAVYAVPAGGTTVKSATLTGVGNPWNSKEAWQTLAVEFEVTAENAGTRIGISSTKGGSDAMGWFQADNFTLSYLGISSDEANRRAENVATYNRIKTDYEYEYSSLLNPDISKDGWTNSDFDVMTANEHWNDQPGQNYYEQTSKEWGENSWEHHADETVTLPEGKYIMTVTARASASVTSSMSVKVGDAEPQVIMLPNKGSVGYGIDVNGTATFAEEATYANNDAGRGWEYCFIEFEVAAGGQDVTIAFDASANAVHQWVSIANPMLYGSVHPKQVDILQINNLAANLRSYESKPMNKALYASFAEDLAAADAATVESENLEEIVSALQADIKEAQASVEAYAAYKAMYDAYAAKALQLNEAGQTFWNENVGEAYARYTNGTITDVVADQAKLKEIFDAALLAQGEDADLTLLITNPNYDNGNEGWGETQNSTGGFTSTYDGKYAYNAASQLRHATVYQENIVLPAGTYCVSAVMNVADPKDAQSAYIYATTGIVDHWGATTFSDYVKFAYYDIEKKREDQILVAYFTLNEEKAVRIGALSWGQNWNGNTQGNFTVDTWTLRRLSSLVEGTTHKNFYGNFTQATVQAEVSAEVQVLDLTTATGLSNITLNVTNPNMLIYATAGQVASSQNNVIVNGTCAALSLADGYSFYVPTAFTATSATYTMNAVATEGSTSMGTLVLPFAVSSMPGKAYELIEEVAMGDVIYATPVATIAANKPVLVSAKGAYTGSGEVAATHGGTYTNGYLVGTYNEFAAPQGSYVLQKHDNNVAFYLVGDVQPTVKPFRAYIKGAEASNLVKSIAIDFGFDATGIEGVESAQGVVEVARYNAAGVRIAAPQKGVNFVRMSDGSVLKVMVK